MYGLPKDIDLGFLTNLELLQVCVGRHELILRFDRDTSVLLECGYEVNGKLRDVMGLVMLLGHRIAVPLQGDRGEVSLTFSEGSVLVFRDSNTDYESYEITTPDKHIIV